ncbi:MAG TPA: hypothetical protein VGC79_26840 [Polyangiaceae bacterium]
MTLEVRSFRALYRLAWLVAAAGSSFSFIACSSSEPAPTGASAAGAAGDHGNADNGGAEGPGAGGSGPGDAGEGAIDTPPEPAVHAFSIKFDYRFDRAGFFDSAERRAALEAAAATWSALLSNDFLRVPAGTRLTLNDPEDRERQVSVESLAQDIDDLLVFVGTSEAIPGYGRGGPAGSAESSDATLQKSFSNRQTGKRFQPWAGSISFKGSVDYFFDPTPETSDDVPNDEYDFISLATHELGHVLGFADSPAFSALEQGATFTGKAAIAVYGGPVQLEADLGHLADGPQSDGSEALMTPKLLNGRRLKPTALDLAVLSDLGYSLK